MLKPQRHGELLLHDSPPVFGKPWYWQRSSSTMESTRSLAQVIMEMRDEIKKLEAENRELRGDYGRRSYGAGPGEASTGSSGAEQGPGMEENPYVNLRRNASAPVLEGQYKGKRKIGCVQVCDFTILWDIIKVIRHIPAAPVKEIYCIGYCLL